MKDAFSLFEHFNPGQTLSQRCRKSASALAKLLDEGIARGERAAGCGTVAQGRRTLN